VEKLSARAEFENDEIVLSRFVEVDELDDIRVIELSHDLHFFEDIGTLYTFLVSSCPW
jgi:hypothetical protein